jgi:GT2 family glycosyltransferase/SAM-dependent methyltransferase
MPECSIVIPVHNQASVTRQCLNILLARPPRTTDAEIIVVNDASTDDTARLLASYGDSIRVVTHEANAGFATACNHGAMVAGGDLVVFLNNDTLPEPGWLDALVDTARRHPKAGIVGSKLLFPDGTVQHAGVVFAPPSGYPTHLYYGFPGDHPAVNKPRRFQAVTGACLMIRRALFEELRGFDPVFLNVFEDVDLCLRAGELGHEVHYCPASTLVHLQSMTRKPVSASDDPVKGRQHSSDHLLSRWSKRVVQDELGYYVEDGLLGLSGIEYPKTMHLSPLVASPNANGHMETIDRILGTRAKQVSELLSKNIQLQARLKTLESRILSTVPRPDGLLPRTWPELRASASMFEVRHAVAGFYLEGSGIEVGALHSPIRVDPSVNVRYVDRMTVAELRRQYPELEPYPLIEPDIIDNGEHLETIEAGSQDFVIASHFLEHCQDPIGTVKAMLRVVRPGGVLYLAVPDKRYTFDRNRPVTTLEHLIRDHEEGPAWSKVAHFEEWATMAEDVNIRGRSAQELIDFDYSIHFHVWTQAEVLELFSAMRTRFGMPFDVETIVKNGIEVIVILRKHLPA